MVSTPRDFEFVQSRDRIGLPFGLVAPHFGVVGVISGDKMNTCSCISVTPRSVVVDFSPGGIQLRHIADAKRRRGPRL